MSWTIPVGILNALVRTAEHEGLDAEHVYELAGVPPEHRDDVSYMLPLEGMMAAGEWLLEQPLDEPLSLKLAAQVRSYLIGSVGFLLRSCPTLGASMERIQRFHNLLSLDTDVSLRSSERVTTLALDRALPDRPAKRLAMEGAIATFVGLGRELTRQSFGVVSVSFPHEIEDTAPYEAYFGGAILRAPGPALLTIEREVLDSPIVTHDPHLLEFLERQAERSLAERSEHIEPSTSARVRAFLRGNLESSAPTAAEAARALAMSRRTMYRQLSSEGTSFKELLDGVRHEFATELLEHASYDLAQIAFILGFSEPRALHRAFKRWTGLTPQAWRDARLATRR